MIFRLSAYLTICVKNVKNVQYRSFITSLGERSPNVPEPSRTFKFPLGPVSSHIFYIFFYEKIECE